MGRGSRIHSPRGPRRRAPRLSPYLPCPVSPSWSPRSPVRADPHARDALKARPCPKKAVRKWARGESSMRAGRFLANRSEPPGRPPVPRPVARRGAILYVSIKRRARHYTLYCFKRDGAVSFPSPRSPTKPPPSDATSLGARGVGGEVHLLAVDAHHGLARPLGTPAMILGAL